MPPRDTDSRSITLVDIPLALRLTEKSVMLDSESNITRDVLETPSSLISNVLLPQRGLHTILTRCDKQQIVGQFRLRGDGAYAQLVYLAPELDDTDDSAWLYALDSLAREAGKYSVHALMADMDEESPLFETMRTAGYAVYARQEIWRRDPGYDTGDFIPLPLTEATPDDAFSAASLFTATIPRLVYPFAVPAPEMPSLVYRRDEAIDAYIAYAEGKHGVYVIPHIHPDVLPDAPLIIESALRQIPRAAKAPVYVCVRRYQDWMMNTLDAMGFNSVEQQALMVKHIAAGVRHANFSPVHQLLESAQSITAKPPTNRLVSGLYETAACLVMVAAATAALGWFSP